MLDLSSCVIILEFGLIYLGLRFLPTVGLRTGEDSVQSIEARVENARRKQSLKVRLGRVAMEVDELEVESAVRTERGAGGDGGRDECGEESEPDAGVEEDGKELFDRIMQECRHNSPGQCFSAKVREEIERLDPDTRARLVSRQRHGCAPLFTACLRGNMACAAYLLSVCGASLEQRGFYRAPGEEDAHQVTPLWAAAVDGRLDVLRALADAGADIDAGSDSGSTPLRSACFMSHVGVARFLLSRGADVRRANHNGGTCLVNAVQSLELCQMLLDAGAEVDATDSQQKTALHYAVQEHREETARLLLTRGADPLRATKDGDDALQIACIKGAVRLVRSLLSVGSGAGLYSAARAADAYELLGATQLDEYNDAPAALASWRCATNIRNRHRVGPPIPKRPLRVPGLALRGVREWTTQEELDAHVHDRDWLRAQALLVVLRVLGPHHKDTLFRLMYRGAAYADSSRFVRCVALWSWVLELRIQKDTLLHPETCQTLLALTRLLLEAQGAEARGEGPGAEAWEEPGVGAGADMEGLDAQRVAIDLLRLLLSPQALPECQRLLSISPSCRVQGVMYDRTLRCVVHLLHVSHARSRSRSDTQEQACMEVTRQLVDMDLRAHATGDTLLHLACSRLTVVRSTYFAETVQGGVFPSVVVARLLLSCGATCSARNHARCTALHVAAIPYNFSSELVETLLAGGAHLDQPNAFGDSPAELVQLNARSRVRPLRHVTLACRAARALPPSICDSDALPATLRPFLRLHRP